MRSGLFLWVRNGCVAVDAIAIAISFCVDFICNQQFVIGIKRLVQGTLHALHIIRYAAFFTAIPFMTCLRFETSLEAGR